MGWEFSKLQRLIMSTTMVCLNLLIYHGQKKVTYKKSYLFMNKLYKPPWCLMKLQKLTISFDNWQKKPSYVLISVT